MNNHELVLVIDFGGQYNQLIARRVREAKVYCEVVPYDVTIETILQKKPKGIIFTGGPSIAYDDDAPSVIPKFLNWESPYSASAMAHSLLPTF